MREAAIVNVEDLRRQQEEVERRPLLAKRREAQSGEPSRRLPTIVDLVELSATEPKPREAYIDGLFPRLANILVSAHGGIGKSLLALQFAVCIAMGLPFFGLPTHRAVVLILSAEDDVDELHRRLQKVCAALGVDIAALASRLIILDAVGVDCALYGRRAARVDRGPPIMTAAPDATDVFDWLSDLIEEVGAEVVILDSVSDTYDASEIERAQVRRYMTMCLSLVRKRRGCVVHIGHIDKAAARGSVTGQTYSGSTAWNNSVRTRIALTIPISEVGGERTEDDGRRVLVVEKTNYGRPGLTIPLRYDTDAGVFVRDGDDITGTVTGSIRDRTERRTIITLLLRCAELGRNVMVAQRANDNAATILGEMDDFPRGLKTGPGRKRLWSHIRRLEDDGLIEREVFKTAARNTAERWKVTNAGRADA